MTAPQEVETLQKGVQRPVQGPEGEGGRNIRGGSRYQTDTVQSQEEAWASPQASSQLPAAAPRADANRSHTRTRGRDVTQGRATSDPGRWGGVGGRGAQPSWAGHLLIHTEACAVGATCVSMGYNLKKQE